MATGYYVVPTHYFYHVFLLVLFVGVFVCLVSLPLGAMGWSVTVTFPDHTHLFSRSKKSEKITTLLWLQLGPSKFIGSGGYRYM